MSTPTTLLGAVVAQFDGDATLAASFAASGGLWVGGIPEDKQSLPLACLVQRGEAPSWNTERDTEVDEGRFDFVIYAAGLAAAEALAGQVRDVFDPRSSDRAGTPAGDFVNLAIAGTTAAWVERQDYQVRRTDEKAADSSVVYEVTLPYKSTVAYLI